MDIFDFINKYKNHPVLFIGTGFSLRYLKNSYSWEDLLKHIATELKGNNEFFLDLKGSVYDRRTNTHDFMKLASLLQSEFNQDLSRDRNGKFKHINDKYYKLSEMGVNSDRFKIYISEVLSELEYKDGVIQQELDAFKDLSKNISSIITTNYDNLIESVTDFIPLVGNDILLSNPYGAVYKIHGSIERPDQLVFTTEDYNDFDDRYDLIRAQLISLFVHNPIIFLGYSVNDINIKKILSTIYKYVNLNSEQAEKIRNNFLLVEYSAKSDSLDILNHDIDVDGNTLRINKIKTDNYIEIYKAIYELSLPVTAYEIKRVLDTVKEITSGGSIKVSIAEDLDDLKNSERILAISPTFKSTIEYTYKEPAQLIEDYFKIIDSKDFSLIKVIDKMKISKTQWFPIFGFSSIVLDLQKESLLKEQQIEKIKDYITKNNFCRYDCIGLKSIMDINASAEIAPSYKEGYIFHCLYNDKFNLEEIEQYLISIEDKRDADYKKLLCLYDWKKYKIAD